MVNDTLDHANKAGYNSAQKYCEQLNEIRKEIVLSNLQQNYDRLYVVLRCFYLSLSGRMNDKMQKENDELYKKATAVYKQYAQQKMRGVVRITTSMPTVFEEWEKSLRKTEDKLGLLMINNSNDPGNAIAEGGF